MGIFGRLREGLSKTAQQIVQRFDELVSESEAPERKGRPVDVDTIEALEELLIMADVGVGATARIAEGGQRLAPAGGNTQDAVGSGNSSRIAGAEKPAAKRHPPAAGADCGVD